MFKKVEVFYVEKVIRINMFISNSLDPARAYIGGAPSKRLMFSDSKPVRDVRENLA
ncbi:hypothetical protein SAMN05216605_107124 [Pseudomonas abietaniphila]|uniref:Uncharacterized protein n=1 Tax=Pseudomonas abietaniphila TaxID=89065 RepID=A0A1G8DR97_9PSED|nr:hypothetical protein SAMN05216605_107124 [Pseudomonas abietaniphila]